MYPYVTLKIKIQRMYLHPKGHPCSAFELSITSRYLTDMENALQG